MQLKDARGGALAAAAMTLLGGVAPAQAAGEQRWQFDAASLLYAEGGGRVKVFEPRLDAIRDLGGDRQVSAGITIDALTGPSPNGAARAAQPQTFTSPSGNSSFTTAPGELPLDPSFKDTRVALDAGYDMPLGQRNRLGLRASGSTEYDYRSLGAGATLSRNFNLNDTTFSAGFNFSADALNPVGGAPTPLAVKTGAGGGGDQTKQVADALLGVSQVLSPVSLMQVNYSLSRSSGYLTDPYKIVSVVDANGAPLRYVFESRPDTRLKHALYVQYKRYIWDRDVLDFSYRFMTDDWGIVSHTFESSHRWNFGSAQYLEPHLRLYRQNAADFYTAALDDGQETRVAHASADPRLGAFDGVTLGLKYGQTLRRGDQWSVRGEFYKQAGRSAGLPPVAGPALSKFDQTPGLNVVMLSFGYHFRY